MTVAACRPRVRLFTVVWLFLYTFLINSQLHPTNQPHLASRAFVVHLPHLSATSTNIAAITPLYNPRSAQNWPTGMGTTSQMSHIAFLLVMAAMADATAPYIGRQGADVVITTGSSAGKLKVDDVDILAEVCASIAFR